MTGRRVKAALGAGLALMMAAGCGGEVEEKADTPSGLPIPRWVSVRGAPASMRAGPGLDYPILWRFERSGAPLQVITETREWRKVCGPDGSVAWIHRTLTTGGRTGLSLEAAALRSEPDAEASVSARMAAGAIVSIEACQAGWCQVSGGDAEGWVPAETLFGASETAVCSPADPATAGGINVSAGG